METFLHPAETLEVLVKSQPVDSVETVHGAFGCMPYVAIPMMGGFAGAYFFDSLPAKILAGVVGAVGAVESFSLLNESVQAVFRDKLSKCPDGHTYFYSGGFTNEPTKFERKHGQIVQPIASAHEFRQLSYNDHQQWLVFNGLPVNNVTTEDVVIQGDSDCPDIHHRNITFESSLEDTQLVLKGTTGSYTRREKAKDFKKNILAIGMKDVSGHILLYYVAPALSSRTDQVSLIDFRF